MDESQNSLSRKSARVFQPTVLFHSQNRNESDSRNQAPNSQPDLILPYMLSLRNYINFPWFQVQPDGNSLLTSKSNGICPLGCLSTTCPDHKHSTVDRRFETQNKITGQSENTYQVQNLLSLVKSTRETRSTETEFFEIRQPNTIDIRRPAEEVNEGAVLQNKKEIGDGTGNREQLLVSGEQKNKSKSVNGRKKLHCPFCNVSCSNHGQLRGHLRCHTGEKPFVCNYDGCSRQFARNEELTRHKRIHSGLRPFICPSCKKTFGRKDHLQKHAKTHLEPGQKKTFVCPVCHQGYSRSDALTRHKATAHSEHDKDAKQTEKS